MTDDADGGAATEKVVVGVARLLDDFEFAFERDGPLRVKYDLTLNLDGATDCRVALRAPRGDEDGGQSP